MNLTADEAKKFTNQVSPSSSGISFLSSARFCNLFCLGVFYAALSLPNTKKNLSRKRLIPLDRRVLNERKTGIAYETVDTGSAPWGFHFWLLNRHLTILNLPDFVYLVSSGRAVPLTTVFWLGQRCRYA